jgi:RNA polymerase sigma-70 factor (ECF subfamily)
MTRLSRWGRPIQVDVGGDDPPRPARADDPSAVSAILRAVAPDMLRVVRRVPGPRSADVDDVLQHALVALVQALPAFRHECSEAGYAARIAFRVAVRARRRLRVGESQFQSYDDLAEPSSDGLPSEASDARRRNDLLRRLLDDLPEEQAEALGLRVMLGWSLEEIAAVSGAPVNTVRSRLRLA